MKECLQSPEGKLQFNEAHFTEAATQYDLATRCLSLGRDVLWKDHLINLLPDKSAPACLDLACGTGDLTFRLADRYPDGTIHGLDLTEAMIVRARARNTLANVHFSIQDMCQTDIGDNSIDIVTGAYALRNAPDMNQALAELYRIMKPGATAAFLDFAKPKNPLLQKMNYYLLKAWGRFWGWALHRNATIHGYISESLITFPHRAAFKREIQQAGFAHLHGRTHFLGMVETLVFEKPD
jgi:demethylmenaquinone methyltransferase/2-methoxy-6-polyprenyl-1,4-benzoquinol methylase